MELLLTLICVVVLLAYYVNLEYHVAGVSLSADDLILFQNYDTSRVSHDQIDSLRKQKKLGKYIRYITERGNNLTQYIREETRINDITGFICACALLREISHRQYKLAELHIEGKHDCITTWTYYIEYGHDTVIVTLRGDSRLNKPGLLLESEHQLCAQALCHAYDVCSAHIHCNPSSVKVLQQLKKHTLKNITEILQEEDPSFLFTTEAMRLINLFVEATGQEPFPFFKFRRGIIEYAVLRIRNSTDKLICPSYFRSPSDNTPSD